MGMPDTVTRAKSSCSEIEGLRREEEIVLREAGAGSGEAKCMTTR